MFGNVEVTFFATNEIFVIILIKNHESLMLSNNALAFVTNNLMKIPFLEGKKYTK